MNSINRIGNISKNQIIISKNDIPRLKKDFGFFEAFIDRNFSNSDQYFDKNGNYILKKELFPEEMVHYDSNSDEEYVIKRNDMWKAIPKALNDYHVPNKILGDFLANYLIFKTHKNSLFNPTVPEQEAIASPNRVFFPGPSKTQLKKQRRMQREINELRSNLGNNINYDGYVSLFYRRLSNQELSNILTREERAEEVFKLKEKLRQQKKQNVENLAEEIQKIFKENQSAARAMLLAQIANANHNKYRNKPGVLPGVLQTRRRQKRKEKRGTQKRAKQRSFKRGQVANNENFNAFQEFQGFEN